MKTLTFFIPVIAIAAILTLTSPYSLHTAQAGQEEPTEQKSHFEKAVQIIKKYETLNSAKHWPYVGYGHRVYPGDKIAKGRVLSEKEADALLRKDLLKLCANFRSYGKDSLLLATLAYNIGPGAAARSTVATKLKSGNREIRDNYVAHSKYKGKTHAQIKRRRIEEFETLYIADSVHSPSSNQLARGGFQEFASLLAEAFKH